MDEVQQDQPDDYVIATGKQYSVHQFLSEAAAHLDLDWRQHVAIDERYIRPAEVDSLLGDATKANRRLGWEPKVDFAQLVSIMVDHDFESAQREHALTSLVASGG